MELLGGILRLRLAENRGAFLSFGERLPEAVRFAVFVILVGAGLLGALVWLLWRAAQRPALASVGLALIVGGGLGNLVDRAARGRVVDFLQLSAGPLHTGVFNLGDAAIVAGTLILLATGFRMKNREA